MKSTILVFSLLLIVTGCSSPNFHVEPIAYSAWNNGKKETRVTPFKMDNRTGEVWKMEYSKENKYHWVKIAHPEVSNR